MRATRDRVTGMPCLTAFRERVAQAAWVLDHTDDIDADFLAVYGLDLDTYPISGPRYLALAYRLPVYQGVMATRVEAERADRPQQPVAAPEERPTAPGEVSLTEFRFRFPGLVSMSSRQEV